MNIKNVEYANYNSYLEGLVKSLSNFCSKCPLKPTIQVVKDLGKIYIHYNEEDIEITVDTVTQARKDCTRLVVNAYFDAVILRPEAFAYGTIA